MNSIVEVVRVKMVKEGTIEYEGGRLNSVEKVGELVSNYLDGEDRENFIVICLDTKLKPTAIHTVSIGSLNASIVHPREVMKVAILSNSHCIIVAHNHPSGNTEPSEEDDIVTERLVKAGEILGIKVLDHIIIGDDSLYSYQREGRIV